MFHMTFVHKLLSLIDCQGDLRGKFSKHIFKNLLIRNQKEGGAETLRTCIWHDPLLCLCFLWLDLKFQ